MGDGDAGTADGRAKYDAVMESYGLFSPSLDTKMSIHYEVFGASIALLDHDPHAVRELTMLEQCDMLRCFALTELCYGSNVTGTGTTET